MKTPKRSRAQIKGIDRGLRLLDPRDVDQTSKMNIARGYGSTIK
jgi:hypothetical protein